MESAVARISFLTTNLSRIFFGFVDRLGRKPVSVILYTRNVWQMVYLSLRAAIFDQQQGWRTIISVVSAQIYFTGWQAMPIITVLALATGGISILQCSTQLRFLGGASMLGNVLVVIIVREVGPLLTALIVIARSGTAVASEIGNMRVGREIEALESMGINPFSYIVFPRIVGGVVSVLCLAFYFNIIALLGGFMVTHLINDMPFSFYAESLSNALASEDVGLFLLKNSFSGMIIFVVSCYQGMLVQQSSHEVPQVTTKAVVNSIIYVVSFNITVTTLFYLSQLMKLGLV
jgi:phospholipid/cholesterol/gamma-HCH transport system permease protein